MINCKCILSRMMVCAIYYNNPTLVSSSPDAWTFFRDKSILDSYRRLEESPNVKPQTQSSTMFFIFNIVMFTFAISALAIHSTCPCANSQTSSSTCFDFVLRSAGTCVARPCEPSFQCVSTSQASHVCFQRRTSIHRVSMTPSGHCEELPYDLLINTPYQEIRPEKKTEHSSEGGEENGNDENEIIMGGEMSGQADNETIPVIRDDWEALEPWNCFS